MQRFKEIAPASVPKGPRGFEARKIERGRGLHVERYAEAMRIRQDLESISRSRRNCRSACGEQGRTTTCGDREFRGAAREKVSLRIEEGDAHRENPRRIGLEEEGGNIRARVRDAIALKIPVIRRDERRSMLNVQREALADAQDGAIGCECRLCDQPNLP